MSLLFSKYTKTNIENYENAFVQKVDLSNNIVDYNDQITIAYDSLINSTGSATTDEEKLTEIEDNTLNKRLDKTPTAIDVRISDEKTQIEQIKYIYLAGTVALISLIIVINNI